MHHAYTNDVTQTQIDFVPMSYLLTFKVILAHLHDVTAALVTAIVTLLKPVTPLLQRQTETEVRPAGDQTSVTGEVSRGTAVGAVSFIRAILVDKKIELFTHSTRI